MVGPGQPLAEGFDHGLGAAEVKGGCGGLGGSGHDLGQIEMPRLDGGITVGRLMLGGVMDLETGYRSGALIRKRTVDEQFRGLGAVIERGLVDGQRTLT